MTMLIISAYNNGKGIKKEKREKRNQLLKLRITILYKNKFVPWKALFQEES